MFFFSCVSFMPRLIVTSFPKGSLIILSPTRKVIADPEALTSKRKKQRRKFRKPVASTILLDVTVPLCERKKE